jgi:HlyD family secretion protein
LHQAEADLDAMRASVGVQRAQAYQAQVNLTEAQRDFERKRTLVEKNFLSPAERDKAQTTLDAARAQVQLTEAQVKNSASVVRQREALVAQARFDLGRTEIRSPVDGRSFRAMPTGRPSSTESRRNTSTHANGKSRMAAFLMQAK